MRNTQIAGLRKNVFFDDSVLFYLADADSGSVDLLLAAEDGEVQLQNARSGEVLASQAADAASQIVVRGTPGADHIVVDSSISRLELPGGLVIDVAAGRDALVLRGDANFDVVTVNAGTIVMNGMDLQVSGVERLIVDAGRGPDDVQIVDRGEMQVVVASGSDDDRPGDGRRDNELRDHRPPRVAERDAPRQIGDERTPQPHAAPAAVTRSIQIDASTGAARLTPTSGGFLSRPIPSPTRCDRRKGRAYACGVQSGCGNQGRAPAVVRRRRRDRRARYASSKSRRRR